MSTIDTNSSTMNLIIDIIRCAELNKQSHEDLMNRLITFAQHEKTTPTLVKKEMKSNTIPLLPPPPSAYPQTHDLIQL